MKKKKKKTDSEEKETPFDPELLRMYMTGATNPSFSNKFHSADEVVDLHLENISPKGQSVPPHEALFVQMEAFEKALDSAIAAGRLEMRVVHGLGKGKLKQEIHKFLDRHPHVSRYENDYHSRYGFGSTVIYFEP